MRLFAEHLDLVGGADLRRRLLAIQSVLARRRVRRSVEESAAQAAEALSVTRDALVQVVSRDLPSDDSLIGWLMLIEPRMRNAQMLVASVLGIRPTQTSAQMRLELLNSVSFGAINLADVEDRLAPAPGGLQVQVPEVEWHRAEQLAAAALRQFGYQDARVTESGADGGIDVRSSRIVAQVKYTSRPVGRPVLQQLVGAADGLPCAAFALEGYTQQAHEYADERGIALFSLDLPDQVAPVNGRAHRMSES